jgi:hypothetical protein
MRHGIVLFTCDRGITPARAAKAAEERGFDALYLWGLPDAPAEAVEAYLDRLAGRIAI